MLVTFWGSVTTKPGVGLVPAQRTLPPSVECAAYCCRCWRHKLSQRAALRKCMQLQSYDVAFKTCVFENTVPRWGKSVPVKIRLKIRTLQRLCRAAVSSVVHKAVCTCGRAWAWTHSKLEGIEVSLKACTAAYIRGAARAEQCVQNVAEQRLCRALQDSTVHVCLCVLIWTWSLHNNRVVCYCTLSDVFFSCGCIPANRYASDFLLVKLCYWILKSSK